MDKKPVISIITVTYNNFSNLKKTIESIKYLNYTGLEYIVIDGSSTDGSINLIKSNNNIINKYISEPDNGIYDAMNKGIKISTGDYLWFMNAGDEVADGKLLSEIFNVPPYADVYYGDTELIDSEGKSYGKRRLKRPPEKLTYKKMINGMIITHQSLIVKKEVADYYDLNLKYCSDIEWTINVLKKSKNIVNTGKVFCKFQLGGFSRKNTIPSLKERYKILNKHFNVFNVFFHQILLAFRFIGHIVYNRRIL